jgi:hypothetical protein
MNKLPISEYFKYHPPVTELRKERHAKINQLALDFAEYVEANIKDEDCKKMTFFAIQQARMLANQGVTIDELHGG